jgi:hypothetical protein
MKGTIAVPEGRKALVTNFFGKEKIVDGPKRAQTLTSQVEIFEELILAQGEKGVLLDEKGERHEYQGPQIIQVHPRGSFEKYEIEQVAANEAIVIIREDGRRDIIYGKNAAKVFVSPYEAVHQFVWSGGTEDKVPGGLVFGKLRLQDDQMYYAFSARTKDQIVIRISLMIFWKVADAEKILNKSSDPVGAILNKIYSQMTSRVSNLKFDEFIDGTEAKLTDIQLLKEDGKNFFSEYGIEIQAINLRKWECAGGSVQKVLDEAGTVMTRQQIATAEHTLNLQRIDQRKVELTREKDLVDLEKDKAGQQGKKDGQELSALYQTLKDSVGEENAAKILAIRIASQGRASLYLGSELLPGGRKE